jgi:hypothetical protein
VTWAQESGRSPLGEGRALCFDDSAVRTTHEEAAVKAKVGDRIVVKGHHLGEPDRDALVLEVHSADGGPPYVVRWSEDGHEGLYFPGNDASVVRYEQPKRT